MCLISRKFRDWQPDARWLFPPSPRDWLPEDHLVYFLLDVTTQVDVSPIVNDYASDKGGQPPFHPRMMLVLLLYAYSQGVFSSRKIMQRCATDAAFRIIVKTQKGKRKKGKRKKGTFYFFGFLGRPRGRSEDSSPSWMAVDGCHVESPKGVPRERL